MKIRAELCLTCAALALLMAPTVQAVNVEANVTAASVSIGGQSELESELVGLIADMEFGSGAAKPSFMLDADHLRVETDYADPVIENAVSYYTHEPQVKVDYYGQTHVEGLGLLANYEVIVVPLEGGSPVRVQASADCTALSPTGHEEIIRHPWARSGQRPDIQVDTSQSTHWTSCESASVEIVGDFLLTMWGHSAQLTTATESVELESGRLPSQHSPHAATDETIYRYQQLFLYATNATLTFPLVPDQYGLFVEDATAFTGGGTVTLESAAGEIDAGGRRVQLSGDRLMLVGDLRIASAGATDAMRFTVVGDVASVYRNGEVLSVMGSSPSGVDWSWLAVLAFVAGLLVWVRNRPVRYYRHVLAVDGVQPSVEPRGRREVRGAGHWLLAYAADKAGDHRRSLRHAEAAHACFPKLPEALALRGRALGRLGMTEQALADFGEVHGLLPRGQDRADVCVEAARTCLGAGDVDQAMDWLHRGSRDDPSYVASQLMDHFYDAIPPSRRIRV